MYLVEMVKMTEDDFVEDTRVALRTDDLDEAIMSAYDLARGQAKKEGFTNVTINRYSEDFDMYVEYQKVKVGK